MPVRKRLEVQEMLREKRVARLFAASESEPPTGVGVRAGEFTSPSEYEIKGSPPEPSEAVSAGQKSRVGTIRARAEAA